MAKLYVTEFESVQRGVDGRLVASARSKGMVDQTPVTFSTEAKSAAFAANTRVVRLHTDGICSVAWGASPTATTNNMRMVAGQTEYIGVEPGEKVSVISNT